MMIAPKIPTGVGVPVFVLDRAPPHRVVAWNAPMAAITGLEAGDALRHVPEVVLGRGALALRDIEGECQRHVEGLGTVLVRAESDLVICTLADSDRNAALGLAVQDLLGPLRSIRHLTEEAMGDTLRAEAVLRQIRRVAREGLATADDVLSVACASGVQGAGFQKVAVRPLCQALMADIAVVDHRLAVLDATVVTDRSVLQAALRALMEQAVQHGDTDAPRMEIAVRAVSEGLSFRFCHDFSGPVDVAGSDRSQDAFRGTAGFCLLGVRRLVHSRGGRMTAARDHGELGMAFDLTLPGCLLSCDRDAAAS